ncbi:MAG: 2-(1,2-epoxy,2-dihydrophenyl)acetyl-CoA isomerase [Frankiales bacterium]|jgi:2-(1,2-epoxy-1,2-dihydrophenyl)acetyl-CoA isomerase|nr:2-(1,2-epoxy,2-dihydrophenyl)acetyl-CoA isomerase [Frankiales bacterium]
MTQHEFRDRIRVEIDGGVARLVLARPDRRNALDLDGAFALRDAAELIVAAAPRVVHVRSDGEAVFSVGGDLDAFAASDSPARLVGDIAGGVHAAVVLLREQRAPIVTEVAGVAAGGGFGLALLGDIVLAGPGAWFRASYTAGGLSPDVGLTWLLRHLVGRPRAMDVVLTNRRISADEAAAWGLVSRVVADDLAGAAAALVAELATGSRGALSATRGLVEAAGNRSLADQLAAEQASISELAGTVDGREGVRAFVDKRVPQFP